MFDPRSQITAIIPAYNEAATIADVIKPLVASNVFRDVIVVSDGSTDGTAAAAREAGASLVKELKPNRGKGGAMRAGAELAATPFIMFCDADLLGLQPRHPKLLIAPILACVCDMCVGIRDRGPFLTWVSRHLPPITGERVLSRESFLDIPPELIQGFRVEIAINAYFRNHKLKVCSRVMPGVGIRRKMQKVGFWKGLKGYISMFAQVIRATFSRY